MENQLKYLSEFKQALENYRISDQNLDTLHYIKLVAMVAPSSAGRNTIIRELMKSGNYHYIVSDTTRQKRVNDNVKEQDGVEYWFRSEEQVLKDLRSGSFLEAAIIHNQQVSGISIRELEIAQKEKKVALADIEIVGIQNIISSKPDTVALFILPPSFEVWMDRMDNRGKMTIDEKRRRLGSAILEFNAAIDHQYYTYIINDDFHNSVKKIDAIVRKGADSPDQATGIELAKTLRAATENWLYQN